MTTGRLRYIRPKTFSLSGFFVPEKSVDLPFFRSNLGHTYDTLPDLVTYFALHLGGWVSWHISEKILVSGCCFKSKITALGPALPELLRDGKAHKLFLT